MTLLEQDITRKGQVDKKVRQMEFNISDDSGEYRVKEIWDRVVYARELKSGHPPIFYYHIL